MYDIFYIGTNTELKERFPFSKEVDNVDNVASNTALYWLVESNTQITDWDIFEFKADQYTKEYKHQWKWNSENYGGVNLIPKRGGSETVFHNKVVCKKQFDILFEQTPGNYFKQNPYSTHVWCVDPEYILGDDINWAPGNFEPNFIHSFHLRGQLEHKYPETEGGIKLFPREWETSHTKYHGFLDASAEYPVMFVKDVEDYAQRNTFKEDYVWLVDRAHKVNLDTFDWVPNPFEYNYIHVFKMPYQLKEKYPMQMGGIRLVPKNWKDCEVKIHKACPVEDEAYDVFFVDEDEFTSETYTDYASRSKTDWFWIVDRDYTFNGKLFYVPAQHEQEYIHVFKIPEHLEERYPVDVKEPWDNRCGGIRLVHKNFDMTKHKYQEDVVPVRYDIFYVSDLNDYTTPARKSRTKMFWIVDEEHQINEEFKYVPQRYDQKCIHIFKFPGDLEHKYPRNITNISDNRAGGIKLVPVNGNGDAKFIDQNPVGGKSYPIVQTDDESIRLTEDSWIVPTGVGDIKHIPWQPSVFEKNTMHVFANGLLRWKPVDWDGEVKEHDFSPIIIDIEYEKFSSYEEGLKSSKFNWFWVVDSEVDVLETFDWNFQPNVFDDGKQHVWQKLNPITGKQYDYGGVSLRHKNEKPGRPKYMREPACTQREFPVYTLTLEDLDCGLYDVYKRLAAQTDVSMMWIVDACVEVEDDFDFSYYPTAYDKDVVHIWEHQGTSKHTGVRLVPTNTTFVDSKQIDNNTFDKLKQMPKVASRDPIWPVETFVSVTTAQLAEFLSQHQDAAYMWTVDPDIELDQDIINESIIPTIEFRNCVHVWQRTDSEGSLIGHGGLRLWPTNFDASSLTEEQLITCSIPDQLILNATAGKQKEFPIYYLHNKIQGWAETPESILEQLQRIDRECESNMYWVVDPFVTLVDDWKWDFIPTKWEEHIVHVFQDTNEQFRSVRLVPKGTFNEQQYTLKEIINNSFPELKQIYRQVSKPTEWPVYTFNTEETLRDQLCNMGCNAEHELKKDMLFTIDSDVNIDKNFIFAHTPQLDSLDKTHVWQRLNPRTGLTHSYGGIRLWPNPPETAMGDITTDKILYNKMKPGKLQYVKEQASYYKQYEIFVISYKEDYDTVDKRIMDLISTKGIGVTHIRNVEGIFNAHKACAEKCKTKMFWVIDADAIVSEDFDFSYIPDVYDQDVVHVWASKNPITGDEYGYGGLKLFNTEQVLEATTWGLDFTTGLSSRFKAMPQISCTTAFNTDEYSTWRSAFRESVKLALKDDAESKQRLQGWLNPIADADFAAEAKKGAEQAVKFVAKNKQNMNMLTKINDYSWLEEYYDSKHSNS